MGIVARAGAKASAMMAQVLRKISPINKMMINWAEKQAPEDRQVTGDVLDAMTQYGVEGAKRSFVESGGRARATDKSQELRAVTSVARGRLGRQPRRPQRLKAS